MRTACRPAWFPESPLGPSARRALLAVGVLALLVHSSLLWLSWAGGPRGLLGDEKVYWPQAQRFAAGGERVPGDALWSSFYPRFLAMIVAVVGPSEVAVAIVQSLLYLVVVFFVGELTWAWSGSRSAALAAAAWFLVFPPAVAYAHYFWPEVLHVTLFLGGLLVLVRGSDDGRMVALAGGLLGLAARTKSLTLPFLPLLVLPFLRRPDRRNLARAAILSGAAALALVVGREPVGPTRAPVESTVLFNLWVGLQDHSLRERRDPVVFEEYLAYLGSGETWEERNRVLRSRIGEKVRREGPLALLGAQLSKQYFRLLESGSDLKTMLKGAADEPGAGYRGPPPLVAEFLLTTSTVLYAVLLAGGVLGVAILDPSRRRWAWVALAFLAFNATIFLGLHVKTRYRFQCLPFAAFYLGCAFSWLAARRSGGSSDDWLPAAREPTRVGVVVTGVATVTVLWLAFGAP